MAKKQKRQVSRSAAPIVKERTEVMDAPVVRTAAASSRYPVSSSRSIGGATEFNPDYSHVIKDLKQIGILAGSFIVVLVVLSFIIH